MSDEAVRPDLDRLADRKLAAAVIDGGKLRATLLELWQRTRMDWGFVTDRLASTFRRETWIGSHERRFIGETLYGLVRHLRRVDLAIARGRRATKPPKDLERLIALLVLERLVDPARAAILDPELDWRAVAGVDEAIAGERKLAVRIGLAASLPDWLAVRMVADWGSEAEALALALNQRAPMTVRANLLVVPDRAALVSELERAKISTAPGTWCDTALQVETRTNIYTLEAFKRGAFETQDEGSQLLADLAPAALAAGAGTGAGKRGVTIVDMCAGAGGKTLAIAARLANRGRIVASDVDGKKLEELRRRARRAQVTIAQAVTLDGTNWPPAVEALRNKADVVMVDAPCSGIGSLRRNPEIRWRLREADLAELATRQRQILSGAYELCAPGGRIVYATCTLLPVENAEVVAAALAAHSDLQTVPLRDVLGPERAAALGDGESFTVTPHRHGTDGFYARVLERRK